MPYELPTGSVHDDWLGCQMPGFQPTARQQLIMDAAKRALDAGLHYNKDVDAAVAADLGVTEDQLLRKVHKTEGGDFGYDVYRARQAVEAIAAYQLNLRLSAQMHLAVGDKPGCLVLNDFKRINRVVITEVSASGLSITFEGTRGAMPVRGSYDPSTIQRAIDRAHSKGFRKDTFAEFVAGRTPAVEPGEGEVEADRSNQPAMRG